MARQPEIDTGEGRRIWTGEVRRVLYRRLAQRFGPYDEWKGSGSPGGQQDAQFDEFCEAYAKAIGAKSGEAVKHQIRFAMPESERGSSWEDGFALAVS